MGTSRTKKSTASGREKTPVARFTSTTTRKAYDLTADAFGGWHLVTNLQSGGGLFAQRIVARKHYDMERAKDLGRAAAGLTT